MFLLGTQSDEPSLTGRERQVLGMVACGMSAKQIAKNMGIAPRTVERHVENCRHKLRARNKTHLVAKAVALGQLRLDTRCSDEYHSRPALSRSIPVENVA
jgi:LuxR family transcriptional regulator, transcriptional regulator of spore coat protein